MNKLEDRAVKKCFVLNDLSPKEDKSKLEKAYHLSARSFSMLKKWATESKHGRSSLENEKGS